MWYKVFTLLSIKSVVRLIYFFELIGIKLTFRSDKKLHGVKRYLKNKSSLVCLGFLVKATKLIRAISMDRLTRLLAFKQRTIENPVNKIETAR